MKIETETLENHQVRLTVQIEPQTLERAKRRAARKISRSTKIPGFRPGKAPYPIVERFVGEAPLLEEALDLLIDDLYPQVIEQSGVNPYGPGALEDFKDGDTPVLQFLVPLAPEVELGDYHNIRFPYEPPEVTEEDVNEVLQRVQENQAIIETVERPAEAGDIVYITISGKRAEEQAAPAENEQDLPPLLVPERRMNVLIPADEDEPREDEWPFPSFARQLAGKKAGETFTIAHTFPEDHEDETLQGVEAVFTVQIDEVKSRELPALDDELAQSVGDYETLEELKQYIRETLAVNKQEDYDAEYDEQVLEKLVEQSTIKYPPQMVTSEILSLIDDLKRRLRSNYLDLDIYLKSRDMQLEDLEEELRPVAERRVRKGLVLMEVATTENIEVEQELVQSEVTRALDQFQQSIPPKDFRKSMTNETLYELVEQVTSDQLALQTVERLRAIARGLAEQTSDEEPADTASIEASGQAPEDQIDHSPIEPEEVDQPASDVPEAVAETGEKDIPAEGTETLETTTQYEENADTVDEAPEPAPKTESA